MSLIDFILNLAGLLLWLNWRAVRFDPLAKTTPATLMGTLRRAEPSRFRRWHLLAALAGLLLLRALLFSLCSFGFAMAVFFLWLLFLSLLKPPGGEDDSLQRLVRLQLGRLYKW